ncbi:hypothetical protein LTR57_002956 [Friedmanniomyces endolithicus]|nr:hypothetical protein LTR57_002956 [Friedmanniomyces endolithicus]
MAPRYSSPLTPPDTPPDNSLYLAIVETGYEADHDSSSDEPPSSSSSSTMQQHAKPLFSRDRSVRQATALRTTTPAALNTTTPHDPRATPPLAEDDDWVYDACALWAQAGDSVNRWSDELASQRFLGQRGFNLTSDVVSARRSAEVLASHERGCGECRSGRGGVCEGRKGARKRGREEEEEEEEEGEGGKRRRVEMEGEARGVWRAVMMGTL